MPGFEHGGLVSGAKQNDPIVARKADGTISYRIKPDATVTALTAADASVVDATYGTQEAAVIENLRTRVNELETLLKNLGVLPA